MTSSKVTRKTAATVRHRGAERPVVVTIMPNGTLGFRLKGTQRTFYANAAELFKRAELKDAENENGVNVGPRGRSVRRGMLGTEARTKGITMGLYRPTVIRKRPDRSRRREKTAVWWGRYVDPATGRKVSVSMQTTDKAAARIAFARIERDAQMNAANPFAAHEKRPLTEHLADWRDVLTAKGNTAGHVDRSYARVLRVFKACGFKRWHDISASRVQTRLATMKDAEPRKKGRGRQPSGRLLSAQKRNHYVRALKGFCRWLVLDRRAALSPLAHLAMENIRTDRRHDRRALTVDELRALLAATLNGPARLGMSGADRAMLYRLAVETCLRLGEWASLMWGGLDLDAKTPTVTVRAAYAKNRREDTLPLTAATAALLAAWRDELGDIDPKKDPVFVLRHRDNVLRAMRADLEAAGIVYQDADGRFADFHALRHTFISNLARGGVMPKLAMDLARHSDISLTMNHYTHTLLPDRAAALAALPDLDAKPESATDAA